MKDRRKLTSQLFLVAASLVMVLAVSVAWFVNSLAPQVGAMSFAAQDSGAGVELYRAKDLTGRSYTPPSGTAPARLTNTVTWEEKPTSIQEFEITIKDMLPGQCEYYLIWGSKSLDVSITDVTIRSGTKAPVSAADPAGTQTPQPTATPQPDGTNISLAQCLAVYLIPVKDLTLETQKPGVSTPVLELTRAPGAGQLLNTPFRAEVTPPVSLTDALTGVSRAYILAVYCDPLYLQHPDYLPQGGTFMPVNSLEGEISFALSFAAHEEESA